MKRRSFLKAALSLLALPGAALASLRRKEPEEARIPVPEDFLVLDDVKSIKEKLMFDGCPACGASLVGEARPDGSYDWACPNGHLSLHGTTMEPGDFYEAIEQLGKQGADTINYIIQKAYSRNTP